MSRTGLILVAGLLAWSLVGLPLATAPLPGDPGIMKVRIPWIDRGERFMLRRANEGSPFELVHAGMLISRLTTTLS